MFSVGLTEILDERVGRDEVDADPALNGFHPERDREMRLPDAWRSEKEHVGRVRNEGERGQVLDLARIQAGLKAQVKVRERLLKGRCASRVRVRR